MTRALIKVLARPRAKRSAIGPLDDSGLVVHLAAPPVDGAANEELISVLAKALGVTKRDVTITRGTSGRIKFVQIAGMDQDECQRRLVAAGKPG